MNATTITIVVVFAAIIAALFLRSSKQKKQAWQDATASLGLEPVASLDPTLSDRILELYKPAEANPAAQVKWSLVDMYRAPDPNGDCYSLTVRSDRTEWKQSHGGQALTSKTTEERIVVLNVRSGLGAPRMNVLPIAINPDPKAGGFAQAIVAAGNALLDGANTADAVDFYDHTEFDRRFLVRAPSAEAARAFLDAPRRKALAELEGIHIGIDGSLIVVSSPIDRIKNRSLAVQEQVTAELARARQVLVALSSRG